MRIYVTDEINQWLKDESRDDGIGFKDEPSDAGMTKEGYPITIEVSEEVAERLRNTFEESLDCSFDEPCFMYNTALEILREEGRDAAKSLH